MNHAEAFSMLHGRFDTDLGTQHHFSDGIYAKEMHIPAGYIAGMHSHNYAHLSILASGTVVVRTDTTEKTLTAPDCMELKDGVHHSIEALTDCIWYCIHATDEKDASKIDEVLIGRGQ
jgi:quercetin dioxygenase-like cupin family protein